MYRCGKRYNEPSRRVVSSSPHIKGRSDYNPNRHTGHVYLTVVCIILDFEIYTKTLDRTGEREDGRQSSSTVSLTRVLFSEMGIGVRFGVVNWTSQYSTTEFHDSDSNNWE